MIRYPLVAALLVGMFGTPLRAGLLEDVLSFDGQDNVLEDNSRGLLHDLDQDGDLSSGDVVRGLIRIDRRNSPTPTPSMDDRKQLIIAYSFEVEDVAAIGNTPFSSVTYVAASSGTGLDIKSLLGDTHEPAGFAEWSKVSLAVMERTFAADDPANNPVSNTATAGADLIDNVLGDGSGYTLDLLGGFDDTDDFYHQLMTGPPGIDVSDIRDATGAVTLGTQSGGFSVLYDNLGDGKVFRPVSATSVINNADTEHDLGLEGGLLLGNNESNWGFADKANIRLNVVPEPSTWVSLLVAGCVGLMLASLRRRLAG